MNRVVYGDTTKNYAFNGFGTRVSKTVSGTTKDFLRAGVGVTAAVLSDGNAHYTPGVSESRSSTTRFFHAGLSNTDAQSTTGSSVTATRRYDAFGNTDASTGTWNSPFGYAGGFGYQDDGSGLKLLGHRLYDSSTGRFVTRDLAKDGGNWYGYCMNNPTVLVDPSGHSSDDIIKLIGKLFGHRGIGVYKRLPHARQDEIYDDLAKNSNPQHGVKNPDVPEDEAVGILEEHLGIPPLKRPKPNIDIPSDGLDDGSESEFTDEGIRRVQLGLLVFAGACLVAALLLSGGTVAIFVGGMLTAGSRLAAQR